MQQRKLNKYSCKEIAFLTGVIIIIIMFIGMRVTVIPKVADRDEADFLNPRIPRRDDTAPPLDFSLK
jgi:hypothetical protein